MSTRAIAAAIVFAATCSIAAAEDEPAYLTGLGTMTCAQFNERVRLDAELTEVTQLMWAQGFMSASNVWRAIFKEPLHNLGAWSDSDQRAYLRVLCEQRPDTLFGTAVQELYAALPLASTPPEVSEQLPPGRR